MIAVKVEVSPGVIWKPLPDVVAYQASIPLLYQMERPQENANDYTKPMDNKCYNEMTTDCLLQTAIEKLSVAYEKDVRILKRNLDNNLQNIAPNLESTRVTRKTKRSLDFIGSAFQWCCGVATMRKLQDISTNEQNLDIQIEKLTEGLTQTLKQIGKDSSEFKKYEVEVNTAFKDVEKRINMVEQQILGVQGYAATQVKTATKLYHYSYQNLRRIIVLTRMFRTNAILNSCKQHQIPSNILEPSTLQSDLFKLEKELQISNQKLAISTEDVTRYYQLPICDCTFTKSKITIHLRVPIISENQSWKLFELVTASFAWYNQSCTLNHNTLYLAVAKDRRGRQTSIRTVTGIALHQCRAYEDKLCYIPRMSGDELHGPLCAINMFRGDSVENLSKFCPMTCQSSTAMLIMEIEEGDYLITHPKSETIIECSNESKPLQIEKPQPIGSLRLHLPCSCKLILFDDVLIPTRYPCIDQYFSETKTIHVIPATWSSLKSFVIHPNHINPPIFNNLSESINPKWAIHVPHLNLTNSEDIINNIMDKIQIQKFTTPTFADQYGYHSHTIFLIWNTVLTILIVGLAYKLRIPFAMVPTAPAVHAKTENASVVHHQILMGVTYTLFGIFAMLIIIRILKEISKWYKKRRTATTTLTKISNIDNNEIESASKDTLYEIKFEKSAGETSKDESKINLVMCKVQNENKSEK